MASWEVDTSYEGKPTTSNFIIPPSEIPAHHRSRFCDNDHTCDKNISVRLTEQYQYSHGCDYHPHITVTWSYSRFNGHSICDYSTSYFENFDDYGVDQTNTYQFAYKGLKKIGEEYDDEEKDQIFAERQKTDLINQSHTWEMEFTRGNHKDCVFYYRFGDEIQIDADKFIIYPKDVPARIAVNAAIQAKIASLQAEGYVADPSKSATPDDIFLDLVHDVAP